MKLHKLSKLHRERSQRVGRGGKRGTTSGRGTKGQKSRSGRVIRPAMRDLISRLPKHRGFRNKPDENKPVAVLNVGDLSKLDFAEISLKELKAKKVLKNRVKDVKILGDGEIKKAITVTGLRVSKSAKIKIEKAGGKVHESIPANI